MVWFPGRPHDGPHHGVCFKKDAPSPPPAPDPTVVANAQTASNQETARTQALLNQINQYTPGGSLVYSQVPGGTQDQRQATVTLSPQGQQAFDSSQAFTAGTYGLANDQLGRINQNISTPFSYAGMPTLPTDLNANRSDVENALYNRATARLDPSFAQQKSALDADLANRGITEGSTAYDNAIRDFNFAKNDAYQNASDQAVAAGGAEQSRMFGLSQTARDQAIQEAMQLRELPLNEASALMSGSQIQNPSFVGTPQTTVAPTDVTGAYGLSQAAQNARYQGQIAQNSSNNNALGGLAGAGLTAAALMAA